MVQQTALGYSEGYKDAAHRLFGAYNTRRIPPPAETINWSWHTMREDLTWVLITGLLTGLVFGLLFGLTFGLTCVMLAWPLYWLYSRLTFGLSTSKLDERVHLSSNEGIHRSRRNGLLVGLFFALPLGLLFGIGAGLLLVPTTGSQEARLGVGLLFGLGAGLFFGLGISLGHGLNAFVQHFVLRFFLWRLNILPWSLISFLNEATERLFLRKVGGSYIFVHRLLLEYFTSLEKQES